MASPTRTLITALPRGHAFGPTTFTISEADVASYTGAVGDANDYAGRVPPLAAVALALRALQDAVALPEGALHTGQETRHHAAIAAGDDLALSGRVAQRSERRGFVITVLEYEVAARGRTAVSARTTIMAPATA